MSMNCDGCKYDGFVMLGDKKASYCKYFKETKQNMDRTIHTSYYLFQHGYCLHKTELKYDREALDLAIEALRQMESEDCISRKDAIEALDRIGSLDTEADREYARGIFRNIPLVTPIDKTTPCNTCEYSDRFHNEEPCYSCMSGFRRYEPVDNRKNDVKVVIRNEYKHKR